MFNPGIEFQLISESQTPPWSNNWIGHYRYWLGKIESDVSLGAHSAGSSWGTLILMTMTIGWSDVTPRKYCWQYGPIQDKLSLN